MARPSSAAPPRAARPSRTRSYRPEQTRARLSRQPVHRSRRDVRRSSGNREGHDHDRQATGASSAPTRGRRGRSPPSARGRAARARTATAATQRNRPQGPKARPWIRIAESGRLIFASFGDGRRTYNNRFRQASTTLAKGDSGVDVDAWKATHLGAGMSGHCDREYRDGQVDDENRPLAAGRDQHAAQG